MAVGQVFTSERPISATVLIVDDEDATRSLCHDVVRLCALQAGSSALSMVEGLLVSDFPV
jgi:hypothetical protein